MPEDNILYYVGESRIPVREKNFIRLTIPELQYKKLAEIADKTGLAISMIIALQGKACSVCGNEEIIITVPKNILSINKSNNGRSLQNRLNHSDNQPAQSND